MPDHTMRTVRKLSPSEFPPLLREIPQPPEELWVAGELPSSELHLLTVVGSRKNTPYGRDVCTHIIEGLRGYPIGIVSGLALGIDGIAHDAALCAGLYTLAVPGSGLDPRVIYPRAHAQLAERIVMAGGGLLSEYPPDMRAATWTFPQRNRIMAGIAHATLLIEASERSGTLITARLASDYDRELLVVPGSIFSLASRGTHQFLKLGATPVTSPEDILSAFGITIMSTEGETLDADLSLFDDNERAVLECLRAPKTRDDLLNDLQLPISQANVLLMKMELSGLIVEVEGELRRA